MTQLLTLSATLRTWLQGKKTYIVGTFGVIYLFAVYFNLVPWNADFFGAIGSAAGLTFLAKIERLLGIGGTTTTTTVVMAPATPPAAPTTIPPVVSTLIAVLALGCVLAAATGCNKGTLAADGAYDPSITSTNATTGVITTTNAPDQLFFEVDSGFMLAEQTIDTVFMFEYKNREMLWKVSPDIKHGLDAIRPKVWQLIQDYTKARTAYIANATATGLTGLQSYLAQADQIASAASALVNVSTNTTIESASFPPQ